MSIARAIRRALACAAVALLALVPNRAHAQAPEVSPPAGTRFVAVSAGERFSCALATEELGAYCWGMGALGQLGAGELAWRCDESRYVKGACARAPIAVQMPKGWILTTIRAGERHACGLDGVGQVYCWGEARFGQLGPERVTEECLHEHSRVDENEMVPCSRRPVMVPLPETIVDLDVGEDFTCAVSNQANAWCWPARGGGSEWQPVRIPLDRGARAVAAGGNDACVLTMANGIRCWQFYGNAPTKVVTIGAGKDWRAVDVGTRHACALDADGAAWCWGSDKDGALGFGHTARGPGDDEAPGAVLGGHRFRSLSVGALRSCAIDTDAKLWCWGRVPEADAVSDDKCLDSNWIWPGTNDCTSKPVPVHPSERFTQVSVGSSHRCGLTTRRELVCWGSNEAGQLGNGSLYSRESLEPVRTGGLSVARAEASDFATFARRHGLVTVVVLVVVVVAGRLFVRWWRAGVATVPVVARVSVRPMPDDGNRTGAGALAAALAAWGFLGWAMVSPSSGGHDDVSAGLQGLAMLIVGGIATVMCVAAAIAALVRLRRRRDDRLAMAALVAAGLMVALTVGTFTWVTWLV